MSMYSVKADSPEIKFGLTGMESIKQNIRLICTTVVGTCPLDRSLGVDPVFIDRSLPAAQALIQVNILRAIQEQEPRVTVTDITMITDGDSKWIPIVKFVLTEEVEEE